MISSFCSKFWNKWVINGWHQQISKKITSPVWDGELKCNAICSKARSQAVRAKAEDYNGVSFALRTFVLSWSGTLISKEQIEIRSYVFLPAASLEGEGPSWLVLGIFLALHRLNCKRPFSSTSLVVVAFVVAIVVLVVVRHSSMMEWGANSFFQMSRIAIRLGFRLC